MSGGGIAPPPPDRWQVRYEDALSGCVNDPQIPMAWKTAAIEWVEQIKLMGPPEEASEAGGLATALVPSTGLRAEYTLTEYDFRVHIRRFVR